ncbi:MAG TPA: DUF697 domain-containing protein [Elainellaceae cyanobacterium]
MTDPIPNSQSSFEHELDDVISGFEDIQSELNYRRAQDAIHELLNRLDLSSRERAGLEAEITSLERMMERLDRAVIQIAAFGMVGRGKSSLLNALVGHDVFETGPIHGVTKTVQSANWSIGRETLIGSNQDVLKVALPGANNSQIELIDTPGIDEVHGEAREMLARQIARQADLILFIVAGDMTKVEYEALSELRQVSKPILLVFNKIDQYPDADRSTIYQTIRDQRVRELLSPNEIVMAAASPRVAKAVRRSDGTLTPRLHRDPPDVSDLKLKILEILHREGKSLVALNTMLYADDVNEHIVQRKMEIRDRSANQVIWNAVIAKAIAVAVNPITLADVVSGAIIDIAMILTLSRLYGISMTQQGAIGLLQKIALSMGGITAGELLATLGLSSLKSLLGLSIPATGGISLAPYLSVALTQAGIAGVSTYGIGQVAKVYLANGASWGAAGPKAVIEQILSSLDEASILNRIRDELHAKLDLSHRSKKIESPKSGLDMTT